MKNKTYVVLYHPIGEKWEVWPTTLQIGHVLNEVVHIPQKNYGTTQYAEHYFVILQKENPKDAITMGMVLISEKI